MRRVERATTAAAVVVGAVAGLSAHNVEEGHHKVLAPREEFAAYPPTRVLPPGLNLYFHVPAGVHRVTLVPTGQTEHRLISLAKTSDDFAVMRTGRLVVAPDVAKLEGLESVALGGVGLISHAAQAAGRHALDEATAGSTARQQLQLSQARTRLAAPGWSRSAQTTRASSTPWSATAPSWASTWSATRRTGATSGARFHNELARPRRPMGLGGGGSCAVM